MATLTSVLNAVASFGTGIMDYINSPERRRRREAARLAKEQAVSAAKADGVSAAVHQGDANKVNEAVGTLLPCVFAALLLVGSGCRTAAVITYVPADRKVTPMELDGVKGWHVPNPVMDDFLKAAQELRALKNKQAVEAGLESTK